MNSILRYTLAITALAGFQFAVAQEPVPKSDLKQSIPTVIARSTLVSHANPLQPLHVSISMPFRDQQEMQKFVDRVSDPSSPEYRNYITPEEVGQQFGISNNDLTAVKTYLESQGFKITLVSKNHLSILADCTVAEAEAAFGTTINQYKANSSKEPGNLSYFSYSKKLSVPTSISSYILNVGGLENFTKPKPRILTPSQSRQLYLLVAMYNAGNQGQGRKIGISNWDGYRLSNMPTWYSTYSLPTPSGGVGSNIHVVSIDGVDGNTVSASGEADLDLCMVTGQAPLADVYIYDNAGQGDMIGVLTQEANDNIVDVVTESYGWFLDSTTADAAHNLHLAMNAQGMTYMAASGDSGTTIAPYSYPDTDPEVLQVGGTSAATNSSGVRISEVVWNDNVGAGGGGWDPGTHNSWNVRPSWQKGKGVPTNINYRLGPDVAGAAAAPATSGTWGYYFCHNGAITAADGTSASSPVFAAGMAIAQQKMISDGSLPADGSGHNRMGRIQDLIYAQNGNPAIWHDITSGNNGLLPNGQTSNATIGWDMASGWGAINWDSFAYNSVTITVPAQITSYNGGTGTVNITGIAPSGGQVINLSSTDPTHANPSTSTVTIPAGSSSATFHINTSNSTTTAILVDIIASVFGKNVSGAVTVMPDNRSTFMSQSVPTTMVCGQSYPITLRYRNTGSTTWSVSDYKVGTANPYNNSNFGMNRIALDSGPVATGDFGTFSATVVGPSTPGTYNLQWQDYQQSTNMFFGQPSTAISVVVTANADAARYISRTGPTTVAAGAAFYAQNTFMNVGTNSWSTSTGYSMMIINPNNNTIWTTTRGYLSSGTIAPGSNGTFTGSCHAPTSPGTYTMQWQMDKNGVPFGDTSPLLNITVTGSSADNATYVNETQVPTSVGTGVTFGVTFTMHNSGSTTWSGAYALASTGSSNFGVSSIAPTGSVSPGNDGTFTTTFTAPASPGTYTFQQRMTNGTTQFGVPTPGYSIKVSSGDAAEYISRTGTLTISAGHDFYIQNTMKNTGTTSWSTSTGYSMMTVNPNNDPTWTVTRAYLPGGTVVPGSSGTFNANCTAPIIAGAYFMQWQMDKSGSTFGETTPLLCIFVFNYVDNAQFVSQSGIPSTIVHGATFTPTITMKNLGSNAWDGTFSLASIGNNNFGVASIPSTAVGSGGTKAFSTTFTAPNTPGTYTFKMRMQDGSTKFGQASTQVTITVT